MGRGILPVSRRGWLWVAGCFACWVFRDVLTILLDNFLGVGVCWCLVISQAHLYFGEISQTFRHQCRVQCRWEMVWDGGWRQQPFRRVVGQSQWAMER